MTQFKRKGCPRNRAKTFLKIKTKQFWQLWNTFLDCSCFHRLCTRAEGCVCYVCSSVWIQTCQSSMPHGLGLTDEASSKGESIPLVPDAGIQETDTRCRCCWQREKMVTADKALRRLPSSVHPRIIHGKVICFYIEGSCDQLAWGNLSLLPIWQDSLLQDSFTAGALLW